MGNLCDLSAAVFPVTKVDPAVDVQPPAHEFRCAQDERIYSLCEPLILASPLRDFFWFWSDSMMPPTDNPEAAANGPISLQVYGRKNEEEAVLRMTEIVDAALKANK